MKITKILLIIISGLMFFLPFFLWGNVYLVGGDDTKLYYVFPMQFIENYALNIASNNTLAGAMTGYASAAYFVPVFLLFAAAKIIPLVSTQMLFYGLNLSIGFIAFYFFLGLWFDRKSAIDFTAKIIASVLYVFSPYVMQTLFVHQLLSMYLLSLLPVCLYLFIIGLRKEKVAYVLLALIIFSLFSSTLNVLPWFMAACISLVPIIIIEAVNKPKLFVKYTILSGIVFLFFNFYWLFHFFNALFVSTGLGRGVSHYTSETFITENLRIATGVSTLFSPLTIPLLYVNPNISEVSLFLAFIFIIPFLLILSSGLLAVMRKIRIEQYMFGLVGFLLSWFLFSPNLGSWGPKLFLSLSTHIPFFIMFRNMFDKFSLPLAFYYSYLLCVSLLIVASVFKKKGQVAAVFGMVIISLSVIVGSSYMEYAEKIKTQTPFSGRFNEDYMSLISYISSLDNASHILWLPLNGPTYANIAHSDNQETFYSGLSPLQELTGVPDYSGRFSFIRPGDFFVGEKLFKTIESGDYKKAGKLFQQMNGKYIIVDHQTLPKHLGEFMYGGEEYPVLKMQNDEFRKEILGKKIKDFGKRYTLYEINDAYRNDKLALSSTFEDFTTTNSVISYKKKNTSEFEITVANVQDDIKLFFLEPYDKRWELWVKGERDSKVLPVEQHKLLFDYANGWAFNIESIKALGSSYYTSNSDGTINASLFLHFNAIKYNTALYAVSLVTFFVVVAYCTVSFGKDIFKRYEKR